MIGGLDQVECAGQVLSGLHMFTLGRHLPSGKGRRALLELILAGDLRGGAGRQFDVLLLAPFSW